MEEIKYDTIFYGIKSNEFAHLNIYFVDIETGKGVFFDGINFYYKKAITFNAKDFLKLDYKDIRLNTISIVEIRQFEDVYFVKMNNGDIFQISSLYDDVNSGQILGIYDETTKKILTPLGLSSYDAVLKDLEEADIFKIIDEI